MIFKYSKQTGFSLVEVLVAISLLLLVIVGPMQILARSINSTNFATEQVNAWFLAQEGLELAQKSRDDLVLADFKDKILAQSLEPDPMTKFLVDYAACFNVAVGCGLTVGNGINSPTNIVSCATADSCKLYLTTSANSDRSSYQHSSAGNSVTPYTRVITMESSLAPSTKVREIKVTSTVTWRTGSLISSQKVEAITYLFNVYDTD